MFQRISRLWLLTITVFGCFFITTYHVESRQITVQPVRTTWQRFQAEHGQDWKASWTDKGRIGTIRGARYRPITGEPRDVARQFLLENAGLFQLNSDLKDIEVLRITQSLSGHHVEFQQTYQGLPVIGGSIEVHSDTQGRVFLVHNTYVPSINTSVSFVRNTDAAADRALRAFRTIVAVKPRSSSVVVVANDPAIYETEQGPQLVHRVVLRSEPRVFMREYIVSDSSGAVLAQRPLDLDSVTGKGKVFDPNPVNTLNNTTLTDQDDSDDAVPATAYFIKSLPGLNDAVGGNFSLIGSYVKMEDIETPSNTPPSIPNKDMFLFTRSNDNFEDVMCYFHIDRNQRYIQGLGFTNINNRQHRVDAHGVDGDDNSHYMASPVGSGYLAFGDGGVDDAEDADIIMHEYGHSIQDNSSNGKYLDSGETGAMGEGFGDFWAASNSPAGFDVACVGEWDTAGCLRRVDGTKHYPEGITNEVHADGEIWSAALWDIFQALGKATTDKLVLESHFLVPASPKFKDGARALLDADEMLFNGDHTDVICNKMAKRGILACLDLIFVVDTTGSMFDDIDAVKAASTEIVNELDSKNLDYRMAIVSYEDFPVSPYGDPSCGDATFHDVLAFTDNKSQIVAGIQGLFLRCGADTPEAVFSGLTHAIDSSSLGSWRSNVTKAIILMGDAPGHNPEPFTGFTPATVIAAAEAADPVAIFPIAIGGDSQARSQFQALANGTGGQLFEAPTANDVVEAVIAAINRIVQPPCTIMCPANITVSMPASCPLQTSVPVNFNVITSNCAGFTVVCKNQSNIVVSSGSAFPIGTSTVTCTATDNAGHVSNCSFTVTVYSACLQDESSPGNVVLFNAQTGQYRFCCGGNTFTGIGSVTVKGCVVTIQHNTSDRRVLIKFDGGTNVGTATMQSPPGNTTCTISDRNTTNNNCVCQ